MSITLDELFTLFEEVEKSGILSERPQSKALQKLSVSYDGIPEIPIAELPWAQMESNDEGVKVSRRQIQQFLDNIKGEELSQKIQSINEVMNGDPEVLKSKFADQSGGSAIASTLSYLVFLKTLTNLISNFNASSAGFSFEAFLGVLLGGGQIATGQATIADLKDKAGTPISLKLYQEKAPKAGGSWTDLIGDLTREPNMMQYVVVTKSLQGSGTGLTGTLGFYRFNLTLDNIVEVMYNTGTNKRLIAVPISLFRDKSLLNLDIPRLPNKFEKEEKFQEFLKQQLGDEPWFEEFKNNFPLGDLQKKVITNPSRKIRADNPMLLRVSKVLKDISGEDTSQEKILDTLTKVNQAVLDLNIFIGKISDQRKQVADRTEEDDWVLGVNGKTIIQFYEELTPEEKVKMLYMTAGYAETEQFDIFKNSIFNINQMTKKTDILPEGQAEPLIGTINIGRDNIQNTLDKLGQLINQNVFVIFQNLKVLTANLQSYFAEGLVDDGKAEEAISSAGRISRKTKQVQTEK